MIALVPLTGLFVVAIVAATSITSNDNSETQYITHVNIPKEQPVQFLSKIGNYAPTFEPVINVNDKKFFNNIKKHTKLRTVVVFYWKSCGPCKRFMPYWNALVDIMSKSNSINFIAIERADMDEFFTNKGKAGGSVYQFPTMRVIDGTKLISSYDNDSTKYPSYEIQQIIASKYDLEIEYIDSIDLNKLMSMIQFVEESI